MSSSPDSRTVPEPTEANASSPIKITGRYLLVRKLGRGGMGAVYLVHDTHQGDKPLALKRVRGDRLDKKAVAILRNEYMALAGLEHPGLARVYDFGIDRETSDYFFTSEFVDGVNLLRASQGRDLSKRDDLESFLQVLAQILRALEYIHSRGLVHGDIKPENILVTGVRGEKGEAAPRVKLIDFGLTKREKDFGGKKVIGTTYYIAPETITGSQVDRRTDLYSLGVVLYHLVAGRPPFQDASHTAILKRHVEEIPAPPSSVCEKVPRALDEIILRLMEKRPTDRFQSALGVLERVNRAFELEIPYETSETSWSYLYCGQLVSREEELRALYSTFCTSCRVETIESDRDLNLPAHPAAQGTVARRGDSAAGRLLLLRGEKGIGKRRLALDLKKLVQTQGAHFIGVESAGRDDEGSNQDFLLLMKELLAIARVGGERPQVLLRVAALLKESGTEGPVFAEMESLFQELAVYVLRLSRFQPLVIHFHDLHRGGKLLLAFLTALVACHSEERVPSSRLLLSASALDRIDCERTDLHGLFLTPLFRKAVREICLDRLDGEGVAGLLAAMFSGNDFPAAFVKRVFEESDGNPGMIIEICQFFLARGLIRRRLDGWTLRGRFEEEPIPGRVRLELKKKIQQLPQGARWLAIAFAVLGNSTPLELAVKLAGLPRDQILQCMQSLYRQKILQEDTSENQINVYSFVHATARDILYNLIPEAERQAFHDRAGVLCEEYYDAQGKKNPERLAVHFLRAGNREKGIRHGIEAAEGLAKRLLPWKAVEIYSEVLRLAAGDRALENRVRFDMARLLNAMGRYQEALEELAPLVEARNLGGSTPAAGQLLAELAGNCTPLGRFRQAAAYLDKAFAIESAQVISGWMVHVLLGFAELHHALSRHEESLRSCERVLRLRNEIHDVKLLGRLHRLLAENTFALEQRGSALKHCQEALIFTDSRSDRELLEANLLFLGLSSKYKGKLTAALRDFELCASLRKKRGAVDGQADVLREMGAVEILLSRPRKAVERLEGSLSLFERCRNVIGAVETLNLLGAARRLLGEYEDSRKAVSESIRRGKPLGNRAQARQSYIICGNISIDRGDFESAEKYFAEANDDSKDRVASEMIQEALCQMAFQRGDFMTALDQAARGLEAAKRLGNRIRTAHYLEERSFLYLRLGKHAEARSLLVTLFDLVRRYHFRVHEGRAYLIQGMILARERGWERSTKSFLRGLEVLKDEGSERDLIPLYLERGMALSQMREHDEAFLCLEEGLYLAKKLNLMYWKCRFQYATGLIESTTEKGNILKAEEGLRIAERYAVQGPYMDMLWQIHYQLGRVLSLRQLEPEALARYREAERTRGELLRCIPESFRQSYLEVSAGRDLDSLLDTHRRRESSDGSAGQKGSSDDAAPLERFGLEGRSRGMRKVFLQMASFSETAPWIWIAGPPGSGKDAVAGAIHRRFAQHGGRSWTRNGADLSKQDVLDLFAELEKEREEARRDTPWWYKSQAGSPEVEAGATAGGEKKAPASRARFTLIVSGVDKLPLDAWRTLLARVKDEAGIQDGLRVLAAVMTDGSGQAGLDPALGPDGAPVLVLPPLSSRPEDIDLLAARFLAEGSKERPPALLPEAVKKLQAREWKGNVRELRAVCERLAASARPGLAITADAVDSALSAL